MRDSTDSFDRRTALRALFASIPVGFAGCNDSKGVTQSNPFTRVEITGTTLVVEFEEDHSVDQITVIQPDGESFASRSVTTGSTKVTVDIGTQYPPGEYTLHALNGEETIAEYTLSISPDVRITDLKLGRNHPDEMYEGATDTAIRSEVIVSLENEGTGPDAITQLRFEGDIPQPTRENKNRSWIQNTSSDLGGEADQITILPDESVTVYSSSQPFTSASRNVSCTPEGKQGQFTAIARLRIGQTLQRQYHVEYTGEELIDCNITISEMDQ